MKTLDRNEGRLGTLVLSVAGDPKTAKTHLAFSAPGPFWYHEFDTGGFNRVRPHLPESVWDAGISLEEYPIRSEAFEEQGLAKKQRHAEELWAKFRKEYKASVLAAASAPGGPGTVIVDTATLLWDTMQAALLDFREDGELKKGRLTYREANAQFRGVVGYARDPEHRCNLILVHHMRPVFEKNERGQMEVVGYEPASHREIDALVDVGIRTLKPEKAGDKLGFRLKFEFCGLDPTLEGTILDPKSDGKNAKVIPMQPNLESVATLLGVGG